MTHIKKDYIVGLDIGTNSCGWVVTDKNNNILKLRGKTAIGSRLFNEGQSAAERRSFRTTRRRLKRRKWRLGLLQEIFDPYMIKVDPYFFARLKESSLSPLDKRKKAEAIIFPTRKKDQKFYHDYPTIYHLRNALMTEDHKFDLREVYLAIHHIVKYRGNFLNDTPISSFNASKIDVKSTLSKLNLEFDQDEDSIPVHFVVQNSDMIGQILLDKTVFKQDKAKKISKLLVLDKAKKPVKDCGKQIANAILGYKTRFENIFFKSISRDEKEKWEFKLNDSDADVKIEALSEDLDENEQNILLEINKLFSAVSLSDLVDEGKTLSQTMIRKYNDHCKDYHLLKQVINDEKDKNKAKKLRCAYDLYVNNRHADVLFAKEILKHKNGTFTKDEFYSEVQKDLDETDNSKEIKNRIKFDAFMPKQRTNQNGVIPFQLHQIELDKIIKNQGKYYPFLAEINPVKDHRKQAPYKLDELVRFKVPYYVGPMVTSEDQLKNSGKSFAWMVRKQQGKITPWNFDKKVDRMESANRFIKRMTTKDTYLLGEDVLPANSLIYQRFTVLNELNNVRINNRKLDVDKKQKIFKALFLNGHNTSVSSKLLVDFIKTEFKLPFVSVKGLSDPKKFNNSLSTYHKLQNLNIINEELNDSKYQRDLEKIIEWSTIFEDSHIFAEKLKSLKWLSSNQIDKLSKIRLQGWGRLSKKLLINLHDRNGQNVMEKLWNSQNNFMQIINQPDFKSAITHENERIAKSTDLEDMLAYAYTSPANKKAVRQVVKVIQDIVKAASGKVPAQIAIEFARDAERNPQLTLIRGRKLEQIYKQISTKLVTENLKANLKNSVINRRLLKDRYYLYFMQLGRDAYTGQPIDIDKIESYDIDHILPQSFIKDDSLNNRVLVSKAINNRKSDHVPVKLYGNHQAKGLSITIREMWQKWLELGLISRRKFNNLIIDPDHLNKYQSSGFINRQLVETSQIIKLVATILQAKYAESEIIEVKARYNHDLRKTFSLYKSREVNDYHHAIDAYLTAITANYLYQVYPSLRPFFVYGKFKKFSSDPDLEIQTIDHYQRHLNFLHQLMNEDEPDEIKDQFNGKVLFKRSDIRHKLECAYNFKFMLVSRETYTRHQGMFKQTVYPRASHDYKSRQLIPRKNSLPVSIYGGYTGNADAYMAIIKIEKQKDSVYKIVGVPMRDLVVLNKAKTPQQRDQLLKTILASQILDDKNGKRKRSVKNFKVLRSRVPYRQVIKDDDKKFMLGSYTYLYNAKQLTLPQSIMKFITSDENDLKDQDLIETYDQILDRVNKYLPLFDINGFRDKLMKGRSKFANLSIQDKKKDILELLNGLHDNPVKGHLKNIGLSTPLGQMQFKSGIKLSSQAELIYQSPTGLFEKRVKICDI